MKIVAATNVKASAILELQPMECTVVSRVMKADHEMVWTATGNGDEYVAEDPLSLLGFVKLHEVHGDNWLASDDDIIKYLPMLEGDV